MKHKSFWLSGLGILWIAFTAFPPTSTGLESALSVGSLNASPDQYDGKHVVVRSYIVLTPEAHVLWETMDIFDYVQDHFGDEGFDGNKYETYCLTIANPQPLMKRLDKFGNKTLTISGTFLKSYLGSIDIDLGACTLHTGLIIDYRDLSKRYLELLAPSELPKSMRP